MTDLIGLTADPVTCNCCEEPTREPIYHAEEGDAYCGRCVAELYAAEVKDLRETARKNLPMIKAHIDRHPDVAKRMVDEVLRMLTTRPGEDDDV